MSLPHAPRAPAGLAVLADEFAQVVPEFSFRGLVPGVHGDEPVAALEGGEGACVCDGLEEFF